MSSGMMRGWWANRTGPQRFDLYTRWTLYLIAVLIIVASLLPNNVAQSQQQDVAWVHFVLVVLGAVVGVVVLRRGLDHAMHGAPVPWRALTAYAILMVLTAVTGLVAFGGGESAGPPWPIVVYMHVLAVVSPLLTWRWLSTLAAALALVLTAMAAVVGTPWALLPAFALGAVGVVGAFRGSVWMLAIVWELERSRQVEADLAVAEERLRFSRDLHDVMGRNLSVIAMRSELAAELARRGRDDDAAEEMLGVRGIAQESLREVREVVRGYRQVDLSAELAGARSVLRAAGTTTKVIGDATDLPPGAQAMLAWVVREGTTNVIRHADAATCTFRVGTTAESATLTIENDGARLPQGSSGTGLSGLTERVRSGGGDVWTDHDRGGGRFSLRARVPLSVEGVGPDGAAPGDAVADGGDDGAGDDDGASNEPLIGSDTATTEAEVTQ